MNKTQEQVDRASAVLRVHREDLLSRANVVAVGVGFVERGGHLTDEVALIVKVTRKVPRERLAREELLPQELDGVPVDVQEVGDVHLQD